MPKQPKAMKVKLKDVLHKMRLHMNEDEVKEWQRCHAEIGPDQGWIRYEEGYNRALDDVATYLVL